MALRNNNNYDWVEFENNLSWSYYTTDKQCLNWRSLGNVIWKTRGVNPKVRVLMILGHEQNGVKCSLRS